MHCIRTKVDSDLNEKDGRVGGSVVLAVQLERTDGLSLVAENLGRSLSLPEVHAAGTSSRRASSCCVRGSQVLIIVRVLTWRVSG